MQDEQKQAPPAPTTDNAVPVEAASAAPVTWDSLGLSKETLELVEKAGYKQPSPIQAQAIPIVLDRHDLIASAQTGTGKTATFVLPMVEEFMGRQGTFGLILAPTREIAQQIEATIQLFGGPRGVRSAVLIGGIDMRYDAKALETYPHIIVATPGRLCDHLDRGNIWLDYIEMVVLDEADRMLDMGFSDQLSRIMEDVPRQRQTLLFSATITPTVRRLAEKILFEPKSVSIGKPLSAAKTVEQRLLWMKEESKNRELQRFLRREPGSVIVFTRSKDGATRVWRSLHSAGFYDATFIHSDRLQKDRELALAEFKTGKYRIMIATDVAARGLHIDGVSYVVNYDLPMEAEDYVHRIGRTGRAGATGKATTFCTLRDRGIVREIEKLIGKPIPSDYVDASMKPLEEGGPPQGERAPSPSGRPSPVGGRAALPTPSGNRAILAGSSSRQPVRAGVPVSARSLVPNLAPTSALDLENQLYIPDGGEVHAQGHSGQRNPRGVGGNGSRDGTREHAPIGGAQGAVGPHDPSRPPKRRRRRGGKGRGKGPETPTPVSGGDAD